MDIIRPEIDVERFVRLLCFVDELERGIDESAGDLAAQQPLIAVTQTLGILPDLAGLLLARFERERQQLGSHSFKVG